MSTIKPQLNTLIQCIQNLENSSAIKLLDQYTVCAQWSLVSLYRGQYDKRANLKTGVTRKQSAPNFPKRIFLTPPDTANIPKNEHF